MEKKRTYETELMGMDDGEGTGWEEGGVRSVSEDGLLGALWREW